MIIIDGKEYIEKPIDKLPFTNACRYCAFSFWNNPKQKIPCYNREDFSCHSDERPDGKDVVFILANQPCSGHQKQWRYKCRA